MNGGATVDLRMLHIDVLRARNYPQTEDDPCACSTFVRLFFFDGELKKKVADMFTTELQENSNAPFYNAAVDIEVPTGLENVGLVIEVVETTRQKSPYVLFYGSIILSLSAKGKQEGIVALTNVNPLENSDGVAQDTLSATSLSSSESPVLGIRYHVFRSRSEEVVKDVHADVVLPSIPVFTGSHSLVPKDAQYVWVSLISDARWLEAFRYALVREWQGRQPLFQSVCTNKKMPGLTHVENSSPKFDGMSTEVIPSESRRKDPVMDVRTVGDVILKRWCCCRSHEVLTRLVISAEAFSRKETSLFFSRERELAFRIRRKERVHIMKEIAQSCLMKTGKSELRDTIDSMWTFFAIGVKHDPSGTRLLSYEARKKIREAGFDDEDKAVLQSSLLNFFVPSLSINECVAIAFADLNGVESMAVDSYGANVPMNDVSAKNNPMAPPTAEIDFAMLLVDFIGPLLDTLTESEMTMAFRAFEPAVVDARQRIQDGAKEEVKCVRKKFGEYPNGLGRGSYRPGGGIKIAHLDILGRRKKEFKRH